MESNEGVQITGSRDINKFVKVSNIPYPTLEKDTIIIRSIAHGVNPTDWKHVFTEDFVSYLGSEYLRKVGLGISPVERPLGAIGGYVGYYFGKMLTYILQRGNVLGSDVSGIVEEVGKNVVGLKKGDIVSASLRGGISRNGGFAKFVRVSAKETVKYQPLQILEKSLLPGNYPGQKVDTFEAAASLTVALKTIALSLHYNLALPPNHTENKDDYLLVWGGATATGFLAIQIAKLIYGINVITTASKRNHDALRELGADEVFDYNDETVIADIKRAGKNRIKYALDCVSTPQTLQSVYDATEGAASVTIDNLLFLNEKSINSKPKRKVKFTNTDGYIVDGRVHFGHKASPEMLQKVRDFWKDSLPIVLENVKTAPLTVLPLGMESANEGLGLLMQNKVNGRKVVFRSNNNY